MSRATLVKVGVAALFGFLGGAAVDINKYRKRTDKTRPFDWKVAAGEWLLAGVAAGLGALGFSGAISGPPVIE